MKVIYFAALLLIGCSFVKAGDLTCSGECLLNHFSTPKTSQNLTVPSKITLYELSYSLVTPQDLVYKILKLEMYYATAIGSIFHGNVVACKNKKNCKNCTENND